MDRSLASLSTDFRPRVLEVLGGLIERGIMVMIVQTSRTPAEHQANLTAGTSATLHSKHLPRRLRGFPPDDPDRDKCDAIDLCPYELYQITGPDKLAWDAHASPTITAAWRAIQELGEAQDLRSGARWRQPHDPGHLELILTVTDRVLAQRERARGDVA